MLIFVGYLILILDAVEHQKEIKNCIIEIKYSEMVEMSSLKKDKKAKNEFWKWLFEKDDHSRNGSGLKIESLKFVFRF